MAYSAMRRETGGSPPTARGSTCSIRREVSCGAYRAAMRTSTTISSPSSAMSAGICGRGPSPAASTAWPPTAASATTPAAPATPRPFRVETSCCCVRSTPIRSSWPPKRGSTSTAMRPIRSGRSANAARRSSPFTTRRFMATRSGSSISVRCSVTTVGKGGSRSSSFPRPIRGPTSSAAGWTAAAVCGWGRPRATSGASRRGVSRLPCKTIRRSTAGSPACAATPPAICGWRPETTFSGSTRPGACAGSASPKAWASMNSTSAPDMRAVRARSASERRTGWSASGPRNSKTTSGSSRRFSSPG